MDSTEKSRIFWHEAAAKAQQVASSAIAVLGRASHEPSAIDDAQALLDHFWRMGFRPTPEKASEPSSH